MSDTDPWHDLLLWDTPEGRHTLLDTERLAAAFCGELFRPGREGPSQSLQVGGWHYEFISRVGA